MSSLRASLVSQPHPEQPIQDLRLRLPLNPGLLDNGFHNVRFQDRCKTIQTPIRFASHLFGVIPVSNAQQDHQGDDGDKKKE